MKIKISQDQIALRIVRKEGRIVPAKRVGSAYETLWIGSELPRRCRQLVEDGLLQREEEREDKKYVAFYPTKKLMLLWKKETNN